MSDFLTAHQDVGCSEAEEVLYPTLEPDVEIIDGEFSDESQAVSESPEGYEDEALALSVPLPADINYTPYPTEYTPPATDTLSQIVGTGGANFLRGVWRQVTDYTEPILNAGRALAQQMAEPPVKEIVFEEPLVVVGRVHRENREEPAPRVARAREEDHKPGCPLCKGHKKSSGGEADPNSLTNPTEVAATEGESDITPVPAEEVAPPPRTPVQTPAPSIAVAQVEVSDQSSSSVSTTPPQTGTDQPFIGQPVLAYTTNNSPSTEAANNQVTGEVVIAGRSAVPVFGGAVVSSEGGKIDMTRVAANSRQPVSNPVSFGQVVAASHSNPDLGRDSSSEGDRDGEGPEGEEELTATVVAETASGSTRSLPVSHADGNTGQKELDRVAARKAAEVDGSERIPVIGTSGSTLARKDTALADDEQPRVARDFNVRLDTVSGGGTKDFGHNDDSGQNRAQELAIAFSDEITETDVGAEIDPSLSDEFVSHVPADVVV